MSSIQGAKVLLTGASGYIGAPTALALASRGCDVHVLGRTDPSISGITFHQADLLQTATNLKVAMEEIRAETLLHLAWSVTPGKFWEDPANHDWIAASLRLFRAFARAGGRRIVGVGTCAEYDWSTSPLTEWSQIDPVTTYGKAKASVWTALNALGRQQDLSVAWARLFFLYGPGEPAGKLVTDAVNALLKGREFATTNGQQIRDFIYVEDAAEALARLALARTIGAVNIGSGQGITIRNLLKLIETETHSSGLIEFGARALSKGEPLELVADTRRLREEVGFTPKFALADGVARTVAWWRGRRA